MITRRRFFSGATGVSAAIGSALFDGRSLAPVTHRDASRTEAWLPAYERKLAVSNDLDMLGIPRSWWHVHRGFHPFTPERVVIVKPQGTYRLFDSERCRKRLLEKGVILTDTRSGRNTLLREKFELILTIVEPMASAYRDGLYFEEWTLGLVSREMMGTSDVGCHLGLVHQFQKSAQPHTINGPAAKLAVPPLMEAAIDDDQYVCEAAVDALGRIGPDAREAEPVLKGLLEHNEECIRAAAAETLKAIGR